MNRAIAQARRVLKSRGIPLENEGQYLVKWGLYYLQRDSDDVYAGRGLARRFTTRERAEKHVQKHGRNNGDLRIVHLVPRGTIARRERRSVREAIGRALKDVHGPVRFALERIVEELT